MKISILDFDETITIVHTFGSRCLDNMMEISPEERMAQGVADAKTNIKVSVSCQNAPFKFSDNEMLCIATYHNNPDYIMGYLSVILDKKITAGQTMNDVAHGIAIRECFVANSDKPLLISYLPKLGIEFVQTMDNLHGKNEQIAHLRAVLETAGHLKAEDVCDFYDDSQSNIDAAANISNIRIHKVSREAQFRIVVTLDDIRKWLPIQKLTRAQAEDEVTRIPNKVILREASDGKLAVTRGRGHHLLIADDIRDFPQFYQTKEKALARLESFGVDVSAAGVSSRVSAVRMFGDSVYRSVQAKAQPDQQQIDKIKRTQIRCLIM